MYWKNQGNINTAATIEAALKRAKELEINYIVVASSSGATAEKLCELETGIKVICVTHHASFTRPGEDEVPAATRSNLEEKGVKLLTTTHLFGGVNRALSTKFQGAYPTEIVASTLRMFGQGMKVCAEISVMALDSGLIPYGEEIIAIAGSGKGADTSCVIVPAHSKYFFDTVIKEIICMPREK